MEMLHTVLNRGCSLWDREALPASEFHGRLERIKNGMKPRAIDLLLVYGDSWRFGNLAFVSHFIPKNRGALAVVPLEGEPALVIQEPSRNNPFSKTLTWIDDVRSVGQFAQGVGDALKALRLTPKRVGLVAVEEQLNIREWNGLVKLLEGAELCDMGDLFRSLRLVKSAAERSALKQAGSILDRSLASFARELGAGKKEYEVAAVAEREARRRGVEDFRLSIARSSEPDIGLRPAGPSTLHKGELLLVSVAACYQRYWAEIGRTFSVGRPSQELLNGYEPAKSLFRKLRDSVKVGISSAAVSQCLTEAPARARNSLAAYGLGNGIGLDRIEAPFLGREDSVPLENGMALTLRVCSAGNGAGAGLISQSFLLGERGLEPLSAAEENLVVVKD